MWVQFDKVQRLKWRDFLLIDDLIYFVMLNGWISVVENIYLEKCEQGIKVNCEKSELTREAWYVLAEHPCKQRITSLENTKCENDKQLLSYNILTSQCIFLPFFLLSMYKPIYSFLSVSFGCQKRIRNSQLYESTWPGYLILISVKQEVNLCCQQIIINAIIFIMCKFNIGIHTILLVN